MHNIDFLDIPIIRSCNLGCAGCMTFSDHKKIKGVVNFDDSVEWLKFWASKISTKSLTLFGGEPLLHPNFEDWVSGIRNIWGSDFTLSVNTNGYYLNNLFDKIPQIFHPDGIHSIIISIQTEQEPYLSKIKENIEELKQRIAEYYLSLPRVKSAKWNLWLDESHINNKQWFNLVVNGLGTKLGLTVCEMYKLPWVSHYEGQGPTVSPTYDYHDAWHIENHNHCQAKRFLTLYNGTLYKCPPVGVLEHTLNTFNLKETDKWAPYIKNYKMLPAFSSDEEIANWLEVQKNPESVCNMCGFAGPRKNLDRTHLLKPNWKYTL